MRSGGAEEDEHGVLRKGGPHAHKVTVGPPKPLCKNFGQLPKLTGDWVDHPDPSYVGLYSQVKLRPMHIVMSTSAIP